MSVLVDGELAMVHLFAVANGLIVECRAVRADLDLAKQFGVMAVRGPTSTGRRDVGTQQGADLVE